jgi:hypothetical protein
MFIWLRRAVVRPITSITLVLHFLILKVPQINPTELLTRTTRIWNYVSAKHRKIFNLKSTTLINFVGIFVTTSTIPFCTLCLTLQICCSTSRLTYRNFCTMQKTRYLCKNCNNNDLCGSYSGRAGKIHLSRSYEMGYCIGDG